MPSPAARSPTTIVTEAESSSTCLDVSSPFNQDTGPHALSQKRTQIHSAYHTPALTFTHSPAATQELLPVPLAHLPHRSNSERESIFSASRSEKHLRKSAMSLKHVTQKVPSSPSAPCAACVCSHIHVFCR